LSNKDCGEALAQKDQRIQVASANSMAIKGENAAKIEVANSEAVRREKAAEAMLSFCDQLASAGVLKWEERT